MCVDHIASARLCIKVQLRFSINTINIRYSVPSSKPRQTRFTLYWTLSKHTKLSHNREKLRETEQRWFGLTLAGMWDGKTAK